MNGHVASREVAKLLTVFHRVEHRVFHFLYQGHEEVCVLGSKVFVFGGLRFRYN